MLSPAGRVVMVSGAGRGIGRAIALRLAAEGYGLSLGLRDPAAAAALAAPQTLLAAYDATDAGSPAAWVAATVARFGRVDAVVANAGIYHDLDVEAGGEAELDAMWTVNAKAPWRLVRAAWPHLKAAGSGRVVTIASMSAKRVKSGRMTGYAMSKFAALAFTHGVRHSGHAHGIRATAVCPGFVATDMTADVEQPPAAAMTQPADLAALVAAVLALPNTAVMPELAVNCVLEP